MTVNVLVFYYKDHFSAFPNFLRSCIATVHLTLNIHKLMILILLVNSKIMKENFIHLGIMGNNETTKNKKVTLLRSFEKCFGAIGKIRSVKIRPTLGA